MGSLKMKVPLDYFLYIIKKFFDDLELEEVSEKIEEQIDMPIKKLDKLVSQMNQDVSLNQIFKFYCAGHPEVKKFWKKKGKELNDEYDLEEVQKEETPVKKNKKAKKENGDSKLLNKKKKKEVESESESESEKPVKKKKAKKVESEDEEDEQPAGFKTDARTSYMKSSSNTPFQRIDNSLITTVR